MHLSVFIYYLSFCRRSKCFARTTPPGEVSLMDFLKPLNSQFKIENFDSTVADHRITVAKPPTKKRMSSQRPSNHLHASLNDASELVIETKSKRSLSDSPRFSAS